MSERFAILSWLGQSLAIGGGLLMLAVVLMAVVRQPVRRRMIGAAAVRIALLAPLLALGPKWLLIPVPESQPAQLVGDASEKRSESRFSEASPTSQPANDAGVGELAFIFVPSPTEPSASQPPAVAAPAVEVPAPVAPPAQRETPRPISWKDAVLIGYSLIAAGFFARWLLAQIALVRVIRRSRPAGRELSQLFDSVARAAGVSPELRVVPNVQGPVCCGLWRPVVLLPQRLAESGDEESLRWIFAHELAHLRRGDAWTAFWFGLAEALYFALPWFWWLKRQVRLCQEFVADAEAADQTRAEEYAAFLVNLSRSPRGGRRLATASGVLGSPSELYRRIKMLLQDSKRVERSCPRRWSLLAVSGLLSLAVILSGVGVARYAVAKPDEPKAKDDKKADKQDKAKPEKEPEEKFVKPPKGKFREFVPQDGNFNPEDLQKHLEKMMEDLQQQLQQGGFQGFQGFQNMQPGQWVPLQRFGNRGFAFGNQGSGRLGVNVEKPSAALVEQLDLPKDQGLVLSEVKGDSPAAKAGLRTNDILLELNGKPVTSDPQELRKLVGDMKADSSIDAVVLRKGKREAVKGIKLPEAKAEGENPFGNGFRFNGNFMPPQGFAPQGQPFQFPNLNNAFNAPAGKGLSVQIANDMFTVHSRDESMDITVGGKIEDGKTVVNSVKVNEGNEHHSYDKIQNVPTKYRDKVNELMKNVVISK
jgi:beta-lactamase regulating signal transducer with metallopeptidase domain